MTFSSELIEDLVNKKGGGGEIIIKKRNRGAFPQKGQVLGWFA